MRKVSEKKLKKKFKLHIYVQLLSPENRAVYEIMWINMVEPDRPQMTI
jgi:hypothetical protein